MIRILLYIHFKSFYNSKSETVLYGLKYREYHGDFWASALGMPFLAFMLFQGILPHDKSGILTLAIFPFAVYSMTSFIVFDFHNHDSLMNTVFYKKFPLSKLKRKLLRFLFTFLGPMFPSLLTILVSSIAFFPESVPLNNMVFALNILLGYIIGILLIVTFKKGQRTAQDSKPFSWKKYMVPQVIFTSGYIFYLVNKEKGFVDLDLLIQRLTFDTYFITLIYPFIILYLSHRYYTNHG